MAWYDIFFGRQKNTPAAVPPNTPSAPAPIMPQPRRHIAEPSSPPPVTLAYDIRRHFYNERGFQTYGSFFSLWEGWATAGHVLTEASGLIPDFASQRESDVFSWPDGLDAALIGCRLPARAPAPPRAGQNLIVRGYPAGSRFIEERRAKSYFERSPGIWIAHIIMPDEPVVTGMSGGAVIDSDSGDIVGILITRNSPADLNNDRDPDESCDFVALSAVWAAVNQQQNLA